MTYMEYFEDHTGENFSWCKPYTDRDEEIYLIMHDGEADSIHTPYYESHRFGGRDFEADMEALARELDPDYEDRADSDVAIILDHMHEVGCAHCPFRHECEAMREEMDQGDYR